jgi:Glycosyl transferase family 11
MIYIELNGRIGNHLFQIATAATLAKRNNSKFAVVCHEKYLLAEPDNCIIYEYIQQFKNNIFKNIIILTKVPNDCQYFNQEGGLFKPIQYYNNIYLRGTFQSEKYFDQELTRKLFQIPLDLRDSLQQRYGHILVKGVTSINVRRGDYLRRPHEYNIPSMRFFKKAINFVGKDTYFIIISDDIKWCKKKFRGVNYFFADDNTPLEDLYLQSLCKNNIISNSTFSWWGAWLNENPTKIVIVPKPWYGKALSHIPTDDLIPEVWLKIENYMPLIMRIRVYKTSIKDFLRPLYYLFLEKLHYFR